MLKKKTKPSKWEYFYNPKPPLLVMTFAHWVLLFVAAIALGFLVYMGVKAYRLHKFYHNKIEHHGGSTKETSRNIYRQR